MKITVLAIGTKLPDWADIACDEYIKRLQPLCHFNLHALAAGRRNQSDSVEIFKSKEADAIKKKLPDSARLIALDVTGQSCSTRQLADKVSAWQLNGDAICFVIGGADGLDPSLLQTADETLSLSAMTLPHALARVVLVEQIYRAFSILNNHPYHRE